MCEMVLNNEKNGVELYFQSKPETDILSMLKSCGYRWHNLKKCWYAKQNTETMNTAHKLTNNETVSTIADTATKNSTTEKVEHKYFPSYDHVGDEKIYKSSDVETLNNHGGYFADINAYIHFYADSCVVIDLKNALKTGKDCKRYSFRLIDDDGREKHLTCELWNVNKIRTFKELFEAISSGKELENISVERGIEKGINTFSPFVEIKPIKTPTKWTVAHVWKAILAGQIYKGVQDEYLTDDYAQDAADNFRSGCNKNLIAFAEDLITNGSRGWRVRPKESSINGTIALDVDCYSFDSNTLYFDPDCNLTEAAKRAQDEVQAKEEHNNKELSQVQDIKPEQLSKTSAYRVTYLEMNDNTKMYERKTKVLPFNHLFYEDTEYYEHEEKKVIESRYQIIVISEFIPVNNEFYEISNTFDRLRDDTDKRIINSGLYIHYVSGYALSEMLAEGFYFPLIAEKPVPYERLADELHMHYEPIQRNGFSCTMSSGLFSHEQIDYRTEHNKLIQEYLRIPLESRTA